MWRLGLITEPAGVGFKQYSQSRENTALDYYKLLKLLQVLNGNTNVI